MLPNKVVHNGVSRRESAGTGAGKCSLGQIVRVHDNPKGEMGRGGGGGSVRCSRGVDQE